MKGYFLFPQTVALLVLLVTVAAGCKPIADARTAASPAQPAEEQVSVMIDSVNYRHDRGMKYTVYDLGTTPPRAIGGAIVDRLGSGGEKGCCLALPTVWRPGMKIRVQWHESDLKQIYPEEYERDLEIPRYDTPADVFVVFYPEHEVEVVVSAAEPGHPEWQGRIKQTPWEACLEAHGRKPCKAALPKMFDMGSAQGFCTYLKEENRPNADEICKTEIWECTRDYEDEEMCKKILWGPRKK